MKKLVHTFLIFICFIIIFSSCKKDEEELKNLGTMKINNVSYTINKASAKGYISTSGNKNNNYVFILTSINGDDTSREISLAISYPYNDVSIDGIYLTTASPKRLDDWLTHYAITIGKNTEKFNNLKSGNCKIIRNIDSDYFNIEFEFETQAGQYIKGNLKGDVDMEEITY